MSLQSRALRLSCVVAVCLIAVACGNPRIDIANPSVAAGKLTRVTATVRGAEDNTPVAFTIVEGAECGAVAPPSANTVKGVAVTTFTGNDKGEDCKVTIEAAAKEQTNTASLYVNKLPLTRVRVDGVSLLALFVVASFAIDRIVRVALALLGLFGWWRRLVPEGSDSMSATKQRIAYVIVALVPAVLVLGWFGKIRLLAALGFAQTNEVVDILFTGSLLIGGADRIEPLLEKMGAGSSGGATAPAKPIEITGRLVLEDSQKKEPGPYAIT